ncbi:ubiquinone biosynthesis protein [Rathayibacter oskolensis]|uniref:Ubiquinone biosynthesis protein n=1 Tax=Rathayibacter oskolensis TaxID=1891671 RepID=A0A1X7NN08_9MICO|nr:AarF/UbiB family protein [Rathayibacter oskolensis]SMH39331.1 ubiquinone biosynthesis protein [Rathayibacter oskolensis]
MAVTVLIVVLAVLSSIAVGSVSRRILGTPVGWPRSVVVGLLVFVAGLPFGVWVARETGIVSGDRATVESSAWVALLTILLSIGWVFALGVGLLVALELFWPTASLRNPIDVVRGALRQRRRTRRYLQILAIASRHGLGWVFHSRARIEGDPTTAEQRAEAVVDTINASGVTFVKLGQVLSTRRDLVPEPYLSALSSLQSGATTLPWETIRAEIADELGRPIEEVFASVDETPLAAASVAQVHTARLLDGRDVVIKVQRPTARAQVEADVDIILRLAERAELHTRQGRDLRATSVARGFSSTLLDELDYGIEYRNTEMIRATLVEIAEHGERDDVVITVPEVHAEASSKQMITMDRVDGRPLSRADDRLAELSMQQRDALAVGLMNVVLEQILVHGVFHADLHPGNVILREDGTLGLIDFGAIGIVERSQREYLAALLLAAASEDDIAATDALLLIVDVPDGADLDAFRHDIGQVLTTVRYRPGSDGSIFTMMLDVIRQHHIALPATLSSAFRSFATLEGCLHVLVPDFDMVERALERVPKLMKRMLSLRRVAASAQAQAAVGAAYARRIPRRVESLSQQLERGTLGVRLRTFADGGDRGFVGGLVAEVVSALISLTAVVLAIVLVVSDSGPSLAPDLRLFDLGGAFIGLLGFLGILRLVRRLLRAP